MAGWYKSVGIWAGAPGRDRELCVQTRITNPAGSLGLRASPAGTEASDNTWTWNLGWCFQTCCLYPSAALALTWSQLPVRVGRRDIPSLSAERGLCASNENREGCTGLRCYPKEKDFSCWQIFFSQKPSPPLLSCFDSALTPFFRFVFLFLVPTSLLLPPIVLGCLGFAGWDVCF